ncbi:DUF7302 family protein [Bacillus methanolicus]|nr:hypothetical protein [Bacillus methanolicus]
MWLKNKKTGMKWYVTEEHAERLLKSGDYEQTEAEEKTVRKKTTAKRDEE